MKGVTTEPVKFMDGTSVLIELSAVLAMKSKAVPRIEAEYSVFVAETKLTLRESMGMLTPNMLIVKT